MEQRDAIRAQMNIFQRSVTFDARHQGKDGKHFSLKLVEGTELDECTISTDEFHFSRAAVQELFNDLWRDGFRPDNGDGSVGQMAATEKHLNDMRTIAFFKLKIDK